MPYQSLTLTFQENHVQLSVFALALALMVQDGNEHFSACSHPIPTLEKSQP